MEDENLYNRLGNENHMLAPGITAAHPNLEKAAKLNKVSYTYGASDGVANALMAHSNDNHKILTHYGDGLQAHLFLDDLADRHAENTYDTGAARVRPEDKQDAMKDFIAANPDSMAAKHMQKYTK